MAREEILYTLYEDHSNNYTEAVQDAKLKAIVESGVLMIKALNKESCGNINMNSSTMLKEANSNIVNGTLETFEDIFNTFIGRIDKIYNSGYTEYIKSNDAMLCNVDYKNLEINIYPYWKTDRRSFITLYRSLLSDAKNLLSVSDDDMNEDLINRFGTVYLDSNGSITNGTHNYLRNQNPKELKSVTVKGDGIKAIIPYMTEYIYDYDTIIPSIMAIKKEIETNLYDIERIVNDRISTNPVNESHSVLLEAVDSLFDSTVSSDEIRYKLCRVMFDKIQEVFAEWLTFSEEKYNRYFASLRYIIESDQFYS